MDNANAKMCHPRDWHPRLKHVVVVWLAAWPTLTLVLALLAPFTASWPTPLKALASVTAMAPIMTFCSVPVLKALLQRIGGQSTQDK